MLRYWFLICFVASTALLAILNSFYKLGPVIDSQYLAANTARFIARDSRARHAFDINSAPSVKGIALSHDDSEIWATHLLSAKAGVSVFDAKTGALVKKIALDGGGGVEIIFSENGKKAYVSQMETGRIFEIDQQTKKILRIFSANGVWTKALALSADGATLFASNWLGDDISEIDIASGSLVRKIKTVRTPRGIYATRDGKYLYIAGFENGDLEKISLETLKRKIIFTSGGALRHIVADEASESLFISDMGRNMIWKVSLADDSFTEFVSTDINPNTIALSPDKKIIFVSCRGKNFSTTNYYVPGPEWGTVLSFDALSGRMLDAVVAGNQPTALDISSDGSRMVFSDFLDARIEVFDIPSYIKLSHGDNSAVRAYKDKIKKK